MLTNSEVITNNKPPETAIQKITTMDQSDDVTGAPKPVLHQVANTHQLVYIQTQPNQKLNTLNTVSTTCNNVIIPQLQLQNLQPMQTKGNQGNMLLGKAPLMLHKPKNGGVTLLLKPVSKPPDNILNASRLPMKTIGKFKSETMVLNNQGKLMMMPTVPSNRLPVTATTNTVQSKFSFMPLVQSVQSVQSPHPHPTGTFINFKITDSKITLEDNIGSEEVFTEKKSGEGPAVIVENIVTNERIHPEPDPALEKIKDKSYELSIVEDLEPFLSLSVNSMQMEQGITEETEKTEPVIQAPPTEDIAKQRYSAIQGVSILKRAYSLSDRKSSSGSNSNEKLFDITPTTMSTSSAVTSTPIPPAPAPLVEQSQQIITTISDPATKEVQIQVSNNNKADFEEPPVQIPVIPTPPPTKRSRKSTLCLRKDYHEIEIEVPVKKETKKVEPEVKITAKPTAADFNFNILLEEDIADILRWEAGIGTLPGSNLRYFINEFGFLEYVTKEEYGKMTQVPKSRKEKRQEKARKLAQPQTQLQMQEEMRCLECGCFGMATEFINPKYCSVDCMNVGEKKALHSQNSSKMRKRSLSNTSSVACSTPSLSSASANLSASIAATASNLSILPKKRKVENGDSKEPSSDDDASVTTNNSHDKFYPWHCTKKGFSWAKYLAHINAIGAPVKLFKDPFPYNRNGFRPGMKLEGIDPQHPSYFCVMTVANVQGYRVQLHFDGYPKNYDFWVNADSMNIFPAGFCEKHDHVLHPPPKFLDFNWTTYLKMTRSTAAPKHLFSNRTGSAIFPTAFRVGMKLEAVDRTNTSLVCVATAKDLMDSRILVHFDSWDDIYDYWTDPASPYIHPVGWCDKNGHRLTPPNDYPDLANFTWEKYLKETNSTAAPVRAFKQRPPTGFKKGMRLECVDKRVPTLVRVASIVEVKDHRLRVSFDGWPDRYSYWVDDISPNIHPVGWCQKTGHPLEPPLTPDDVYDFLECATVGCRGVGNIKGPIFTTHTAQKYCPYADENIDMDKINPDRLLTPDRELEAIVPVSREPKTKKLPKKTYETNSTKTEWLEDADTKEKEFPKSPILLTLKQDPLLEEINIEEMKMREKHSTFFKCYAKIRSDPRDWPVNKVCDYVKSLPFVRNSDVFARNYIDGESFLMLTQQDLIEVLEFKLGPAIALYNCILLLRKNITACT